MNETEKQKLKEKLAVWAEFEAIGTRDKFKRLFCWKYPDACVYSALPDFPGSLDACNEWLIPKARKQFHLSKIEFCYSIEGYICGVKLHRHFIEGLVIYVPDGEFELEATWLCKAIEKLIDG